MSRNEVSKLRNEIIKIEKDYINIRKKFLEEKDPNKKEKLYNKGMKIYEKMLSKNVKMKELTAFNTPHNTPVKSKKIDPQKRKIMEQNKIHGNNNINLKRIKKKSRKK